MGAKDFLQSARRMAGLTLKKAGVPTVENFIGVFIAAAVGYCLTFNPIGAVLGAVAGNFRNQIITAGVRLVSDLAFATAVNMGQNAVADTVAKKIVTFRHPATAPAEQISITPPPQISPLDRPFRSIARKEVAQRITPRSRMASRTPLQDKPIHPHPPKALTRTRAHPTLAMS